MVDSEYFGRFLEPALLILISLADAPKHGYAIIEDVASFASVRLGPGTLYGALARLERLGWITPLPSADRRHPYQLTEKGEHILQAQLAQLQHITSVGSQRALHV